MKTFLIVATMLGSFLALAQGMSVYNDRHAPQTLGTCTGAAPCTACKNCHYCKFCHSDGGTCGICRPQGK